jgi:hypothetical protein
MTRRYRRIRAPAREAPSSLSGKASISAAHNGPSCRYSRIQRSRLASAVAARRGPQAVKVAPSAMQATASAESRLETGASTESAAR